MSFPLGSHRQHQLADRSSSTTAGWTGLVLPACGVAALAFALIAIKRRRHRQSYWQDKVIVISGGPRGLGLELTRIWLKRGARVAFCSRSKDDIDRALKSLAEYGDRVFGRPCDVTSAKDVRNLMAAVVSRWGVIDAVVNNAGIMTVGPVECMTTADYRAAMDTHFWGALHMIEAALPHLKRRRGHIVNIASVGGQISVPHMAPYSASKFALVGLSEGLRAELAASGVQVTTVCPGIMRTGSPRNALFKGQHRREYAWFSIAGSLPFLSIHSRLAALRIVNAAGRGQAYLTLSLLANLAIRAHGAFPRLFVRLMGLVNRMLPSSGGIGTKAALGVDSSSSWSRSVLTLPSRRAAFRNNELR
jgi:NAD(P)-dependent dehydrogenase (short-subunit alcohol dehydrogenase family)